MVPVTSTGGDSPAYERASGIAQIGGIIGKGGRGAGEDGIQMDEASGVVHYSDTRSYTIEPLTADTWLLTINGAFDTPKPSDPAISGRSPITIYKITENEMEWEYTYYSGDEGSMTYYQYVRRYQSDEQGVENVLSTSSARKILRNNQILILRGEKTYTLTGQQLK